MLPTSELFEKTDTGTCFNHLNFQIPFKQTSIWLFFNVTMFTNYFSAPHGILSWVFNQINSLIEEMTEMVQHSFIMLVFFFFKDFLMWAIFKVFIESVTILFLFYVLVFWLWSMWDFSSSTRDWTPTPCIGRWSANHWTTREVPIMLVLMQRVCHESALPFSNFYQMWLKQINHITLICVWTDSFLFIWSFLILYRLVRF